MEDEIVENVVVLSPTLRLWKSFSQGIPLLVLLDLFEQRIVMPDRPNLHHLISRPSYPHFPKEELLSEYSRRVNILNLRGQLPEACNLSVRDVLVGSGDELLKVCAYLRCSYFKTLAQSHSILLDPP